MTENISTILHEVLSVMNKHSRDDDIQFFEENHQYKILTDENSKYTSVTTWCHSHFPHFDADNIIKNMMKGKNWKEGHKYWGMTAKDIKEQWDANKINLAGAGTNLHYEIECFMNNPNIRLTRNKNKYTNKDLFHYYLNNKNTLENTSIEWQYFINFIQDHPDLIPYRTEWTVYNEDTKIAGSIDMVYENPDGTLSIYDWKRVKQITKVNNFNKFSIHKLICHLPDANFWHYSLQLNTYKSILEEKYNVKIKDMYLVHLHPDSEEKNYELFKVHDLSLEVSELLQERK